MICFTLLSSFVLKIYYSKWHPNVRATWAILNIRVALFTPIITRELMKWYQHALPTSCWYMMTAMWVLVATVRAYLVDVDSVSGVTMEGLRFVAFSMLLISQSKTAGSTASCFCFSLWRILGSLFDILNHSSGIYQRNGTFWIGFNYITSSGLMVCSVVFNHEYWVNYLVAEGKLSTKQLFVRYVSHEVRTPLNSCVLGLQYIHSMLDNLEKMCKNTNDNDSGGEEEVCDIENARLVKETFAAGHRYVSDVREVVSEIEDSCATALEFINNLLLYEKIDSMNLPLYFKTENLKDVCRNVLRAFNISAIQNNIRLRLRVHEPKTPASGDECGNNSHSRSSTTLQRNIESKLQVLIDAPKVMVILRNLVSNAIKFTPKEGQVTIAITPMDLSLRNKRTVMRHQMENSAAPPSAVDIAMSTHFRVSVTDTGPGLSAAEQKQLFGSFVQFSPNERQQGGGSGIGLYLSQKIAESHGSKLHVLSPGFNGNGTTFYFDLENAARSEASLLSNELSVMPTGESDEESRPEDFGGCSVLRSFGSSRRIVNVSQSEMSVLIVDDSVMNRKMLKRVLQQHNIGKAVEEAADGMELLSLVGVPATDHNSSSPSKSSFRARDAVIMPSAGASKQFDVVLVDSMMPRMNGGDAVHLMREHGYKGLIVGLTGNALQEELMEFCERGADYALPKPLEMEKLLTILESHGVYD